MYGPMATSVAPASRLRASKSSAAPGGDGREVMSAGQCRSSSTGSARSSVVDETSAPAARGISSRPASCNRYATYAARRPPGSATVVMPVISTPDQPSNMAKAHASSVSPPKSVSR